MSSNQTTPTVPALPEPPALDQRYPYVAAREALDGADGQFSVGCQDKDPDGVLVLFGDHLRCPRDGSPKRTVHDEIIVEWAARLEAAHFTGVRIVKCGVSAIAPRRVSPITARVASVGTLDEFRHSVTFEGYGGECSFEFKSGYSYAVYQAADHRGRDIPLPPTATTHAAIVTAIATYYDLPGPVEVEFG